MKAKRIVFSFDARSLQALVDLQKDGQFTSLGAALRNALQIHYALQTQAQKGFTEVIVRNPKTRAERVVVIPSLL